MLAPLAVRQRQSLRICCAAAISPALTSGLRFDRFHDAIQAAGAYSLPFLLCHFSKFWMKKWPQKAW